MEKVGEDCAVYISNFIRIDKSVIVLRFGDSFFDIMYFVEVFIDKIRECDIMENKVLREKLNDYIVDIFVIGGAVKFGD